MRAVPLKIGVDLPKHVDQSRIALATPTPLVESELVGNARGVVLLQPLRDAVRQRDFRLSMDTNGSWC